MVRLSESVCEEWLLLLPWEVGGGGGGAWRVGTCLRCCCTREPRSGGWGSTSICSLPDAEVEEEEEGFDEVVVVLLLLLVVEVEEEVAEGLSSSCRYRFFFEGGGLPSLSSALLLGILWGSSSGMASPLILRHSAVFIRLGSSDWATST